MLPPRAETLPTRRPARASRLPVSTSHQFVSMPSTSTTIPPMPSTRTAVPPTQPLLSDDSDSDFDALLNDLLGNRTSHTYSSLARSHSGNNASSSEARNAASLEHQLIRPSLAPTIRAAYRRGVNMLRRYITSVCPALGPFLTHAAI